MLIAPAFIAATRKYENSVKKMFQILLASAEKVCYSFVRARVWGILHEKGGFMMTRLIPGSSATLSANVRDARRVLRCNAYHGVHYRAFCSRGNMREA